MSSTYYVNLESTSGSSGLGTSASPWNYFQLRNYLAPSLFPELSAGSFVVSGDVIKLIGIRNYVTSSDPSSEYQYVLPLSASDDSCITLESWNLSTSGLWGFEFGNLQTSSLPSSALSILYCLSDNFIVTIKDMVTHGMPDGYVILVNNSFNHSASPINLTNSLLTFDNNIRGNNHTFYLMSGSNSTSPLSFYGSTLHTRTDFNIGNSGNVVSATDTFLIIDKDYNTQLSPTSLSRVFSGFSFGLNNVETNLLRNDFSGCNLITSALSALSGTSFFGNVDLANEFANAYSATYDKLNYIVYNFSYEVSGTQSWLGGGGYTSGIDGLTRLGAGAFYFLPNVQGQIGSFYFGPVNIVLSANVIELSTILLQPSITVVNSQSGTVNVGNFSIDVILLQPTVYAFKDISVSFVGVPVKGASPLTVEFTAFVNFSSELKGIYRIKEYRWCFDYDSVNETCNSGWVITTQNPYKYVYNGYKGQKYSVKLCVELELI
jgi:hypothetical protein